MAAAVPETAPFVRAAASARPGLKNVPTPVSSVAMQMQRLVYGPLKSAADRGPIQSLAGYPFLIVIDGLDECEDKDEVGELIDSMLAFFDDNPSIPLRIFITSRVEQHIQSRLNVPGVHLDNLADHCSDDDITAFLEVLFQDAGRRNAVIQAYVRQHGEWPTAGDKQKLVQHIGGSFIFASAVFKFIMGSSTSRDHETTPMTRLPLALKMNPGLDGLYTQTLERSENIPHFSNVISTVALLQSPLSTSGIAEVLGICTYEVVNVLVDLQAIIQVPGTDDIPVTLCHTSLRDFLTTQSRSGRFFAHPRHHAHLYLRLIRYEYELCRQRLGAATPSIESTSTIAYSRRYSVEHLEKGRSFLERSEAEFAICLCRKALALHPGRAELIQALADALYWTADPRVPRVDLEEAISLYRQALSLRPPTDEGRWLLLHSMGFALENHYELTGDWDGLEEAISVCQEALKLRSSHHSDRPDILHQLAGLLRARHHQFEDINDLEEAVSLDREALDLRASPHPDRSASLNQLAISLREHYRRTNATADLEEAISLSREAVELRQPPHRDRSNSLNELALSLRYRYRLENAMADLEEAISLYREALELRPPPDPDRSLSLNNLAISLGDRYRRTAATADLEEAILLGLEGLELPSSTPSDHPYHLLNLSLSLEDMYGATGDLSHLQRSISFCEKLLDFRVNAGQEDRVETLDLLARLFQKRFDATGQKEDLARLEALEDEANRLSAFISAIDT
ncbi:hypothetical protein MD484_g6282, partial [Candolleomyces efflorescens]